MTSSDVCDQIESAHWKAAPNKSQLSKLGSLVTEISFGKTSRVLRCARHGPLTQGEANGRLFLDITFHRHRYDFFPNHQDRLFCVAYLISRFQESF